MAKIKRFRKGQLAIATCNTVLVTGPGDKSVSYPVFAGVVVWAIPHDADNLIWPVGMYSETWSAGAFKHTDLRINKIMASALKKNP